MAQLRARITPSTRSRTPRSGRRGRSIGLALACSVAAAPLVAGCGSSSPSASPPASTAPLAASTTSAPGASPSTAGAASTHSGRITLHATGAVTIDVSGAGAYCMHYVPSENMGVNYGVSSTSFQGSGGWDFHIQGDGTKRPVILLNTDSGDFTGGGSSGGGTVTAGVDLHHATFDLALAKVSDVRVTTHVTGTIDCA